MKRSARLSIVAVLATLTMVGCSLDDLPFVSGDPGLEEVAVTPDAVTIEPGQSAGVTAEVRTTGDVEGVEIGWASPDPGVATVEPTGERAATVTGQAAGTVTVTATATAENVDEAVSGTVDVTVPTGGGS